MCSHTLLDVCFYSAMPHIGTHPLLGCTTQLAGHHHTAECLLFLRTDIPQCYSHLIDSGSPLLELSVKSPPASFLYHRLPRAPLGSHSCQEKNKENQEKGRLTF